MDIKSTVLSEIVTKRQILHDFTYVWNLKKKKHKLIETENRLVVARDGDLGLEEMSKGDQKVQTSSYKVNSSRDVIYSMMT